GVVKQHQRLRQTLEERMSRRFLLGAERKMVAVKEAVTANGAFIHLADTQRQLVAQPRRIAQTFSPVDGPKNDGYLIGAFRARLFNGIQEGIDASVRQHLLPADVASFKEMAAAHVREVIP